LKHLGLTQLTALRHICYHENTLPLTTRRYR